MVAVEIHDFHTHEVIEKKYDDKRRGDDCEDHTFGQEYGANADDRFRKEQEIDLLGKDPPSNGLNQLVRMLQGFHHGEARNLHTRQP